MNYIFIYVQLYKIPIIITMYVCKASQVMLVVKNLPANAEDYKRHRRHMFCP